MPTDERLERVKRGETDLGLEALYFQFGRYLLIASSRPGGLPANLQGLWNDSMFPPWDSDYHLNINLQMNYWPAEVTNLAELHQPLFDYLESLREPGRKTARVHYGANGLRRPPHQRRLGLHDSRRSAALRSVAYGRGMADPASVGALSVQSRSRFLAKAYPVMKEAAEFFLDYLVEDPRAPGRLVSGPSVSPENRYRLPNGQVGILSMGPSMDHQIITGLFTQVIRAERDSRHRRASFGAARRARKKDSAAGDRQTRTDSGMGRGLRRARSRAPAHLAAVRAASRRSDHGARHARARARGSRDDRAAARQRRRPYGLEPRMDHQFLGASAGRRAGATPTIRRCWRSPRCRICGIFTRRFRSTAISAVRQAWPKCCCRATMARFICCLRCRGPGPTARSAGFERVAE